MDNPFCGTSASLAEAGHSNEEATCRHQTSHDLALIDPGLFPGQARSAARGVRHQPVRHQPKSAFDFVGNRRSACTEMAVRFRPSYTTANSHLPLGYTDHSHKSASSGHAATDAETAPARARHR